MALFGNPIRKKFTNMENGQKMLQKICFGIDKVNKILAQ